MGNQLDPQPAYDVIPGSDGGLIEAIKRGVIVGLRRALTGVSLSEREHEIHVDMEYPVEEINYPSVWVQFSLNSMSPSGMGHEMLDPSGRLVQQWRYEGRVTLTIVALKSVTRDRIADSLISMYSFPRRPGVLENGHTTDQWTPFFESLFDNPYVGIQPNLDSFSPGGQSVTVGVPWKSDQLVYEDAYSFNVIGEYQKSIDATGAVRLSRIDIVPEIPGFVPRTDDDGWH